MRSLLAAFVAVLSLLLAAVPVGAAGEAYRATVSRDSLPAGTTSTLVITLKQLTNTSTQRVRSARVTAPGGTAITDATAKKGDTDLTVDWDEDKATVNDIPALTRNETATITLEVAIRCGQDEDKTWAVAAKSGADFETGGSPLAQAGDSRLRTSIDKCSLQWEVEPKAAEKDARITGAIANPGGTRIRVQLLDGNGEDATQSGVTINLAIVTGTGSAAALYGDTTATTNGDGEARFGVDPPGPKISASKRDYQLKATAEGITGSGASAAFDIYDVAKVCDAGDPCGTDDDDDTRTGNTTVSINGRSTGGVLTMNLGLDDDLGCNDRANQYYKSTSAQMNWDITNAQGRTVIVIQLDAADVDRAYNLYDVCFSSTSLLQFRNRYNVVIRRGESGLLKICPPRLDKQDTDPCVEDKWRGENGDVFIRFSVPPGDPRGRI